MHFKRCFKSTPFACLIMFVHYKLPSYQELVVCLRRRAYIVNIRERHPSH